MKDKNDKKSPPVISDLVTIIIPIFNAEKYLICCLESVLEQDYENFEAILINDGSTDSSGKICDQFSKKDVRFKVIHSKNNGPAEARNLGINVSTGVFIFFLDADDVIKKNTLQLLVKTYNETKVDLVIGGFYKLQNGFSTLNNTGVFEEDKLLSKQDIINYTRYYLKKPNRFPLFAYSWGRLFKSKIIKHNNLFFNPSLHTFEDVAFNFDYLNFTNEVYFLNKPIYTHVIYDNFSSATMAISDHPQKLFGYEQALSRIGNYLESCNSNVDIEREVGHAFICLTIIQLIRACGQINSANERVIQEFVYNLIHDLKIRDKLVYYSPTKGDSKILPILIKLKFSWAVITVCKFKALKRYKRRSIGK